MSVIHHSASEGYTKNSQFFSRGRPDYPPAVNDWLKGPINLEDGKTVVELGAGTGKFTKNLVKTGARVIAIEPLARMRERFVESLLGIDLRAGTAEAIPVKDSMAHAVVCAQSFHWFATPAVLEEIHRVLRPNGVFGMIWNVRDERVPWVAKISEIIAPYIGDTPRFHTGVWRQLFPAKGFGPLQERSVSHAHAGPADLVIVDRILSISFIAALSTDEQGKVAEAVRQVIHDEPDLRGQEMVAFPYLTVMAWCVRDSLP